MTDSIRARLEQALAATHNIERELGGGGMARVFLATEQALGRQVVIKTLPDEGWSGDTAARFRREIQTAAQLQHAHIVPVLTAGDAAGLPYFTMPWVDGASLRERILRGPVPVAEALSILRDVALALSAAHARGIVHRDIKPENVLLSGGSALVTDFGVAKALTLATQSSIAGPTMTGIGVSIGTLAYMAPEQIAGEASLDQRADLYAWGMLAYELLAGERPFSTMSGTALTRAQLTEMPKALGQVAPSVSPAVAALVMRCLAKHPGDRPSSAAELLEVLELPSGERSSVTMPGVGRRGMIAVAAVLAIVAVGFFVARGRANAADERVIAVAPFRVGGAAVEAAYLREGLADLIAPMIAALPNVSSASMRVVLDRWRRAAGSNDADLDDDAARGVARDAGAGQLILGDIVGTRDRLTVSARLLRSRDGAELATRQVTGSADSLSALATRVVTALLSIRDGATQDRLRTVLSSNSEAIVPYLRGEQLFRRGRYAEAGREFAIAWRADTTLAIAALRTRIANSWIVSQQIPGPWLQRAWDHRDRLTGSDSLLLLAITGDSFPRPMRFTPRLARVRELAISGNSAELWYQYGDLLVHNGSLSGVDSAWHHALEAFKRAEALDSSFTSALEHQPQAYLAIGDSAGARAALERQARLDPEGDWYLVSRLVVESALGTPASQTQALRALIARRPSAVVSALRNLSGEVAPGLPPNLPLLDSLFAIASTLTLDKEIRATFDVGKFDSGRNTGRMALAIMTPAMRADPFLHIDAMLQAMLAGTDTASAIAGAIALERSVRSGQWAQDRLGLAAVITLLGSFAASRGDTARTLGYAREIETLVPPANRRWESDIFAMSTELLRTQVAVIRGDADALRRLRKLDTLLTDLPGIPLPISQTWNMIVSSLYERLDQPADAYRVLQRRDGQLGLESLTLERLRRSARTAERAGQRENAINALRRLIGMRAKADPQFQAEVQELRARLARLEAESRGR